MNSLVLESGRRDNVWSGPAVWVAAFLSPTVCFFMALILARVRVNVPPALVLALFFLVPITALAVCEWVAWSRCRTAGARIGWMVFTLLAMLVQFAVIGVVLRVILVTAIGYAQ